DRAQRGDAALRTVAHDLDTIGIAGPAEQVDHAELAEVVVDDLARAVGEHRIDDVAALRDHADDATRCLDDERDAVVLYEEVADQAGLRGSGDQLARIGDLSRGHDLSLSCRRRQLREKVAEPGITAARNNQDRDENEANSTHVWMVV